MGPSFRLEVPIFNQGKSRLARATAELRRAENRLAGLAVEIRSQTRELRDRLISLRDMARFYHDDVLPTRIKIVNKVLLEYNAMQLSPYELFLAKSQELEAERNYIDTLRDYWITRAKLERTVGGRSLHAIQPPSLTEKPRRKNHEESTCPYTPPLCRRHGIPGGRRGPALSPACAERGPLGGRLSTSTRPLIRLGRKRPSHPSSPAEITNRRSRCSTAPSCITPFTTR